MVPRNKSIHNRSETPTGAQSTNFRLAQTAGPRVPTIEQHLTSFVLVPLRILQPLPCRACLVFRNELPAGRRDRYVSGRFAPVDKFDKTRNRSLLIGANRYSDRFIRRIGLVSPCGGADRAQQILAFRSRRLSRKSRDCAARHGLPSSTISRLDRYHGPASERAPPPVFRRSSHLETRLRSRGKVSRLDGIDS